MGLYIYNCNSFVIKNDCTIHIYYISRKISVLMWMPQTDRPHCILKNYSILHLVCASAPSQCSLYHDSHLRCFPLLSQLSRSNSPLANHASMLAHLRSLYHNDAMIAAMNVPSRNNMLITKSTFISVLFRFLMFSKTPVE